MTLTYIRLATQADLSKMLIIAKEAKELLASADIPQWQNGYPSKETLLADITKQISYVLIVENKIAGFAALLQEPDDNYQHITEGTWDIPENEHYTTIHRIAISSHFRGQHLAETFINHLISISYALGFKQIRVDTHEKNARMRHLIKKAGFNYAGIVYMNNNSADYRNAYQLFLD
ncbi:MAG: GNAT family N-acetyltransferase [Liquorilactobacillus hordei]|uniref:GNAT family N-acetyltransferase n=1 Tax=Liquorilactobacillus hordei TaxID=468911 RepID=A0A3S6QRD9_9LACO|nr:GNAT family N-acetyltransferase [Liquorilactobacillus hordei]AUJ30681.1 GNAT family N-acetyltransferase [Liquorilactobacillus hordei]MBZ2405969.1 N-acetyltransferase [Liquorilactobacillus hordei]QYH51363.1 GNAT family N-acetyltransferase [Liquorilactobacillus hordei DSM 19519]